MTNLVTEWTVAPEPHSAGPRPKPWSYIPRWITILILLMAVFVSVLYSRLHKELAEKTSIAGSQSFRIWRG
jgi:hypothetical protein